MAYAKARRPRPHVAKEANKDEPSGDDDDKETVDYGYQADDATPPSHAEDYNLFLSQKSATGYKGVSAYKNGRFCSQRYVDSEHRHLGTFQTAVEAAVAYAKDAAGDGVFPDTEANKDEPSGGDDDKDDRREQQQAEDVAPPSADGYTLFLSKNATGFLGVYKAGGRFIAQRRQHTLGKFSTAVEAAVAYAKDVEADGAGSSSAAGGGSSSVAADPPQKMSTTPPKTPPASPEPAATQLVPSDRRR